MLVYGVHSGESPDLLNDFREQTGVSFPFIPDQGTKNLFAYPSGVGYPYPRDVVIDGSGVVRSIRNSFNPEETEELVLQLLAE